MQIKLNKSKFTSEHAFRNSRARKIVSAFCFFCLSLSKANVKLFLFRRFSNHIMLDSWILSSCSSWGFHFARKNMYKGPLDMKTTTTTTSARASEKENHKINSFWYDVCCFQSVFFFSGAFFSSFLSFSCVSQKHTQKKPK